MRKLSGLSRFGFSGCIVVFTGLTGCVLDFEKFPTEPGSTANPDDGGTDVGLDFKWDADRGTDPDVNPDSGPTIIDVGTACESDETCGSAKVCSLGFCTVACDTNTPCEQGSCATVEDQQICIAACDACGVNATLACVSTVGPLGIVSGCLPDADGDGATDYVDNCPDLSNVSQSDRDADGVGDACDAEPQCVAGGTDGILEIPPVAFDATGFSVAGWTDSSRVAIVGGRNPDGTPNTKTMFLDLSIGKFEPGPDFTANLGVDAAVSPHPLGTILTTGAVTEGGRQTGRFVILSDDQQFAGSYNRNLYSPKMISFGNSQIAVVARISEGDPIWRIMLWNPTSQTFSFRYDSTLDVDRAFYAGRDRNQRGFAYTDGMNPDQLVRFVRFTPDSQQAYDLDLLGRLGFPGAPGVKPFMTPGAGDSFYIWDRDLGTAYLADVGRNKISRRPNLDLTLEGRDIHWVSLADGPGFILVGKNNAGDLFARVYNLPCWSAAKADDEDHDTIADVGDTCPFVPNTDQVDTDADGVGDACVADADGDGLQDQDEVLIDMDGNPIDHSLDSDNDGDPNATDADDDNDGVPDVADVYPYDYDNDGFANAYDADDDSDGYVDTQEDVAAGQSFNPLSFPESGRLMWVEGTGSNRKVFASDLGAKNADLIDFNKDPIDLVASIHYPRWFGRDLIFALDGEPGVTNKWVKFDLANDVLVSYDFGGPLGGVDPIAAGDPTEVAVTLFRDGVWDLVVGQVGPDVVLTPQNVGLEANGVPDARGHTIAFTAGPVGCSVCDLVYYASGSSVVPFAPDLVNVSYVRYNGPYLIIAQGTQTSTALWVQGSTELVPPGIVKVTSVTPMLSYRHYIVAGETSEGMSEIWLYNTITKKWYLIKSSSNVLGELDWTL